ncbi:hypothetical protein MNBD_NITROSPINAE01-410 [hydrothermal vent metagenome]|uniref:Uncharacterized protein n=1 Tax=hydrothermal vent metagenome TaxID=652676 RepID=A0A3B1CAA3_9ZZZZ
MINKSPPKTNKFNNYSKLFTYPLFGAVVLLLGLGNSVSSAGEALTSNTIKANYSQVGYFQPLDNSVKNESLKSGTFLVAKPGLRGGNFEKAVILLVQHQEEGSWGVIINQPTVIPISRALPSIEVLQEFSDPLFFGGPVSQNEMVILIRSSHEIAGAQNLFGDLYISGDVETLNPVLQTVTSRTVFRAYAGSANWAPGQLQAEVDSGNWWVVNADVRDIFDKLPSNIWSDMAGVTEQQRWVKAPADEGFKLVTYSH